MATIAMMIGGAIVNAVAFSGSNYLFSSMNNEDAKNRKKAREKLLKAKEEFEEKRISRLDFINEELKRHNHAVITFRDVESAMREYSEITGKQLPPFSDAPKLSQFYNPSDTQKRNEVLFIIISLCATTFLVYKMK